MPNSHSVLYVPNYAGFRVLTFRFSLFFSVTFRLSIFCLESNLHSSPKASQTKTRKKNVPQLLLGFFFFVFQMLCVVGFAAFLSLFITIFSAEEIKATENFSFGQLSKHKPNLLDICYFAKNKNLFCV